MHEVPHSPSPSSTHTHNWHGWPPVFPGTPQAESHSTHHELQPSPPAPPVHHWTPRPMVEKFNSYTASLATITGQPCAKCSPQVWTSTMSIPAPPGVPSVPHSSSASPSIPATPHTESKPTSHAIRTNSRSHGQSSTHGSSHVMNEATLSLTGPNVMPKMTFPAENNGGAKVHGSMLAMLAFVATAIIMSAFS